MPLKSTLRCPCEGAHLQESFSYSAPPAGETAFAIAPHDYQRSYRSCAICGHMFGVHNIDLSSLYHSGYVDSTYGGPAGMAARLNKILALPAGASDNAGRVACIDSFLADHPIAGRKRLLDVGAGLGVFPAVMKDKGWSVTAVEPDARTTEHLTKVVGIVALNRDLLSLTVDEVGQFDLISFNKVLEHVEDPVALLEHAPSLMAENGFCYVELPDTAAINDGPGREEFFIEHHHVFSPASLVLMAERAGFEIQHLERLREPSGKYTIRAFLKPDWRIHS